MKCKHFPQAFKSILIKLTKEKKCIQPSEITLKVIEKFSNFNARGVLGNFIHLQEMINWFFFLIFFIKLNGRVPVGDVEISFV